MKTSTPFLKSILSFAVLPLVLLFSNVQGQCPATDIIQDPQDFMWTYYPVTANNPVAYYSGVIEVGQATFIMNNGQTLTTRAYRQQGGSYSIPGPTIKVVPGNKYVVSLHNTLPYAPLSPDENVFKDPNVSNLHTHGLHISGESPGDDITRHFEGGRGGDFVWDIPADHMGGTFWYHAHHHGSSFLHISGGLFGLLIVDDGNDGIPANVAAMPEREIVLGYLDPGAAGTGGDVLLSGTLTPTWTVNGLINGNICLPPNTWEHWRVLTANRDAMVRTLEFGPGVEVMLLARDGVWRTVAPLSLATRTLELTGASRADFAIRATTNSFIKIDGTTVANIFIAGSQIPGGHPFAPDGVSTWSAIRPDYLRDLRNETSLHLETVSMGARTINGSKWNHDVPTFSLPANQVQQWSLSGAVQHPFHLHIYHVQAQSSVGSFEVGEYYDVLAANMNFRFDLSTSTGSPYDGRTVLHCHVLGHEDRGAMGWLDVNGGAAPPTFPVNDDLAESYSVYYTLAVSPPAAPSSLIATTLSNSSIGLTWIDNSSNEDGFDIERSSDGVNFSPLAIVGAGVTSYTNSGLTASTTYDYRVRAYNTAGNSSWSNIASATTLADGPVMHVHSITVVRQALNGGRFRANATVTIHDALNIAVSGASVTGIFTGPTSGTQTGTTNASGQVTFTSASIKNPIGEWCFEVTNVTLAGASYNPAANLVTKACESGIIFLTSPGGFGNNDIQLNLLDVYPNPFQNLMEISFELKQQSPVNLEVYNVLGERVAVITDRSFDAGRHFLGWNTPQMLDNGTYFLHFKAGNHVDTRKLMLIR